MLVGFFLSIYFSSLLSFSFVSHPIVYCVLLLCNVSGVCGVSYWVLGFSWYVVLLCLVYVGGVYVLFIFISVQSPNNGVGLGLDLALCLVNFLFFSLIFFGIGGISCCFVEESYYLCSFSEGCSYCFFCLVMLLGFVCVSSVVNHKNSFYR